VGTLRFPGGQVRLFDAAGIGMAQSLPDKVAIRRAIGAANRADFLVVILDACSGFIAEDKELLKLLRTKPGVVVWNKIDKVSKVPVLPDVAGEPICISALRRENLPLLLNILKQEACSQGNTFFGNRYQEDILRKLTVKLRSALDAGYLDMQAKDLREALELISTSDRSRITNELLEDIFSRFCVGK
jgi:tRNA modification GTPase